MRLPKPSPVASALLGAGGVVASAILLGFDVGGALPTILGLPANVFVAALFVVSGSILVLVIRTLNQQNAQLITENQTLRSGDWVERSLFAARTDFNDAVRAMNDLLDALARVPQTDQHEADARDGMDEQFNKADQIGRQVVRAWLSHKSSFYESAIPTTIRLHGTSVWRQGFRHAVQTKIDRLVDCQNQLTPDAIRAALNSKGYW